MHFGEDKSGGSGLALSEENVGQMRDLPIRIEKRLDHAGRDEKHLGLGDRLGGDAKQTERRV